MITVLAGGVGAAKYLAGLLQVVEPSAVTAIVNTGDDTTMHGLRICPDLDTVTYTLAGASNTTLGWGLEGETWQAMDALSRFEDQAPPGSSAGATWFRLGDRDLATHLYRTQRLAEGAPLSTVAAELARSWGLVLRLVPATDDRVATMITVAGEGEVGFQDYFVGRRHSVPVTGVRFDGIEGCRPAPGVLHALDEAERIVIAPSNPVVSIGPVVAVPGISDRLRARRADVVAVSPIVAGGALKGPADRMLTELGHEASVAGVARLYAPLIGTLVIDVSDADLVPDVEAAGVRCVVAPTVMHGPAESAALARTTLDAP
ncbi:MAG: 2-phospho-L-lactate transferase [Acidimicrobiales bacterium]